MNLRILRISGLVGFIAISSFSVAQRGPSDWPLWGDHPLLKKCIDALPKLRYAGIRRVTVQDGRDNKSYTERILRDGLNVRIEFPNDSPYAGQITIDTPEKRLQYLPGPNEIRQLGIRRSDWGRRPGGEGRPPRQAPKITYSVKSGQRIAGRKTTLLEMKIGDEQRLGQRLWIDQSKAMVLKREIYGGRGESLGGFEFTSIKYDVRIPSNAFEINRPGAKLITPIIELKRLATEIGVNPLRINDKSFELTSSRKFQIEKVNIIRQSYWSKDGRISLFLSKSPIKNEWLKGPDADRFSVITGTRGSTYWVLMGEVKSEILKRLSTSLGV